MDIAHSTASLDLSIEYLPIEQVAENPLNPRLHPDRQIKALIRSITEFGFVTPIIIGDDNGLIAGHGRLAAARKLGIAKIPVVRLAHLDPHQLRALMIADNRLTDMSHNDTGLLAENFKWLTVEGLSLDIEATGYSMGEIDLILDPPKREVEVDPDDELINPAHGRPVNRVGDVWQLGSHRLVCGSSLDGTAWSTLMDGEQAVMSCSDVPYNVKIGGHVSGMGKVQHREFCQASGELDRDAFTDFLQTAFQNMANHSRPGSLHYAFIDWRHLGEMQTAGEGAFTELKNVCVWDKGTGGGMGSLYRSAHELVFLWKAGRGRHRNNVELGRHGRNRTNIFRYPGIGTFRHSDEGDLLQLHPTVKPVRMIADMMLDVTARGDIVIDGFLGSGTSIIAAERVGRRCFGIELDPIYADVIIRRFERHSGEEAVHLDNGKTYAELALERAGDGKGHAHG